MNHNEQNEQSVLDGTIEIQRRSKSGARINRAKKVTISPEGLEIWRESALEPDNHEPFTGYGTIRPKCPGCKTNNHQNHTATFESKTSRNAKCRCFACTGR